MQLAGGVRAQLAWRALEPNATVGLAEATLLPQTMAHCMLTTRVRVGAGGSKE
jgi:hypothetical protein